MGSCRSPGFDPDKEIPEILRLCQSLVISKRRQPSSSGGKALTELELVHPSLASYISETQPFGDAEKDTAQLCLRYLSKLEETFTSIEEFPFARYCAQYWMDHARRVEDSPDIQEGIQSFLTRADKIWGRLFDPDEPFLAVPSQFRNVGTPLYYASLAGLTHTVTTLLTPLTLLQKKEVVNAPVGRYGYALQAASFNGYLAVVKTLLDHGANVNAEGGEYGNALQAASSRRHFDVVKKLLDAKAEIDTCSNYYGNALYAASLNGDENLVELLLAKNADANVQCGEYGNALQAASSQGHENLVEMLLTKRWGGRFCHKALDTLDIWWPDIRLMHLRQAERDSDELWCDIKHTKLMDGDGLTHESAGGVEYKAISYRVGIPELLLRTSKGSVLISRNLDNALRQFRSKTRTIVL
jgi:hypothetical protein